MSSRLNSYSRLNNIYIYIFAVVIMITKIFNYIHYFLILQFSLP